MREQSRRQSSIEDKENEKGGGLNQKQRVTRREAETREVK